MTEPTVWTIGHSTRSAPEFAAALSANQIELVADVRRLPGSRRLPQFDSETLSRSLAAHGIDYCWIRELGGRRRPEPDSRNTAWRHPAFRAYADHMASEEFAAGLFELLMLARGLRTALMCAEVLWWRCHRRLVSDALVSLGIEVVHIFTEVKREPHRLAPPARLHEGVLRYEE
jgi:uncharacterized protein (DUF488 family)